MSVIVRKGLLVRHIEIENCGKKALCIPTVPLRKIPYIDISMAYIFPLDRQERSQRHEGTCRYSIFGAPHLYSDAQTPQTTTKPNQTSKQSINQSTTTIHPSYKQPKPIPSSSFQPQSPSNLTTSFPQSISHSKSPPFPISS